MPDLHVVVLAAGKGTRMKSALPKVLHPVAGVPMIARVLETAARLNPRSTTVVVGHQAEQLTAALSGFSEQAGGSFACVVQEPQLGTAHALLTAASRLEMATGTLVLLSGDVPLLSVDTLARLVAEHDARRAAATVATSMLDDPRGYGRIVRVGGHIARIVEEKDASPAEREIREVNAGIYAFAVDHVFAALRSVAPENAQGEYYLPDLFAMYRQRGLDVGTIVADADEIRGINTRRDLALVGRALRQAKNRDLMAAGVTIEDPDTTYIDRDVVVGADTVIHPGVSLQGRTRIGARCTIHVGVRVADSVLGDRVTVLDHSLLTGATIANGASVGPFAHLRNEATVGEGAKIGNFVEMKKSALGPGSKAMHLAYIGDASIGAGVNIGAGTITCNYDGSRKQRTTIEDAAFIGSDTQLIAPVTVGRGAYVGTGTTVREDVPPGALAVSAGKQRNIEDWVKKRKKT